MNKQPLKDYGNGIHASNDFLARIALEAIAYDKAVREARLADHKAGRVCQSTTWNISDRH